MVHELEELGATPEAAALYAHLVESGPADIGDVAAALHQPATVVSAAVESLEPLGLVTSYDGVITPTSPRAALDGVESQYRRRAAAARDAATLLEQLWSLHRDRGEYLEVAPGMAAARSVQGRVFNEARGQVRALSIGSEKAPRMAEGLDHALQSGVRVRTVYGAQVLRHPAAMEVVRACIALGEESRVFPQVPVNLLIADDHLAMLVVRVPTSRRADALVIRPSDLFDTMVGLFDAFWRMAVPIAGVTTAPPAADSHDTDILLTNMAAGLTDGAIANDLGVSERTVRRRITALQDMLGAQTRFQLGVQLVRHGWL